MIPSSLGYGDKGRAPITAGATIFFTITLQVNKLWSVRKQHFFIQGIVRSGRQVGGASVAGGGDQFKREVLNPLGCPADERSRDGDWLLVTYKVSWRREGSK